jgi:hypothetical protein
MSRIAGASPTAEPPTEFDTYELVMLRRPHVEARDR